MALAYHSIVNVSDFEDNTASVRPEFAGKQVSMNSVSHATVAAAASQQRQPQAQAGRLKSGNSNGNIDSSINSFQSTHPEPVSVSLSNDEELAEEEKERKTQIRLQPPPAPQFRRVGAARRKNAAPDSIVHPSRDECILSVAQVFHRHIIHKDILIAKKGQHQQLNQYNAPLSAQLSQENSKQRMNHARPQSRDHLHPRHPSRLDSDEKWDKKSSEISEREVNTNTDETNPLGSGSFLNVEESPSGNLQMNAAAAGALFPAGSLVRASYNGGTRASAAVVSAAAGPYPAAVDDPSSPPPPLSGSAASASAAAQLLPEWADYSDVSSGESDGEDEEERRESGGTEDDPLNEDGFYPFALFNSSSISSFSANEHIDYTEEFDISAFLARSFLTASSILSAALCHSHSLSAYTQQLIHHHMPQRPTVSNIFVFMKRIFEKLKLNTECAIISLIYVERLMEMRQISLTERNWLPLVMTAILIASKVWDDHGAYNAEFSTLFPIFSLSDINLMEMKFVTAIQYHLYISSSAYAAYYFGLRALRGTQKAAAQNTRYLLSMRKQRNQKPPKAASRNTNVEVQV